ncbi:MAG: chitobiase/beta-hexosaminidase C-terminal domain-containing protein, partial [Myxococcales bacterium]
PVSPGLVPPADTTAPSSRVDTPAGTIAAKTVTISADEPATIFYTLDGSDPRQQDTAQRGEAPVQVEIKSSATLRFFAVDTAGNAESATHAVKYVVPVKGRLTGRIVVDPAHAGKSLVLGLYDRAPAVGVLPVSTNPITLGPDHQATWTFTVTSSGVYHLLAWLDANDSNRVDPGDLYAAPAKSPVVIDVADPLKWGAEGLDIYVGLGDPDFGSVRGTVHLAPRLASQPVTVVLMDRPFGKPDAKVLAFASAGTPDPQGRAAYVLYSLKSGEGYLAAVVDVGADGDEANNEYGVHPGNPVVVALDDPAKKDHTIDLWVGVQNPALATISGTLHLSAAYAGGGITVHATEGPVEDAVIRSSVRVTKNDTDSTFSYTLPNLNPGSYNVVVTYTNGRADSYRVFPGKVAVDLGANKAVTGKDLDLGVGVAKGEFRVKNAATRVRLVGVLAMSAGSIAGYALRKLGAPTRSGVRTASYEIFGLDDGTYNLRGVVDENGNGAVEDEARALNVHNATPPQVTIRNGSTATGDFDVTL